MLNGCRPSPCTRTYQHAGAYNWENEISASARDLKRRLMLSNVSDEQLAPVGFSIPPLTEIADPAVLAPRLSVGRSQEVAEENVVDILESIVSRRRLPSKILLTPCGIKDRKVSALGSGQPPTGSSWPINRRRPAEPAVARSRWMDAPTSKAIYKSTLWSSCTASAASI